MARVINIPSQWNKYTTKEKNHFLDSGCVPLRLQKKSCVQCEKSFVPSAPRQGVCRDCDKKNQPWFWSELTKSEQSNYRTRQRVPLRFQSRRCGCGDSFTPTTAKQVLCDSCQCRPVFWDQMTGREKTDYKRRKNVPLRFQVRTCECGNSFTPLEPNQANCNKCHGLPDDWDKMTALERCNFRRYASIPLRFQKRECRTCNQKFTPQTAPDVYCSVQCKRKDPVRRLVRNVRSRIKAILKNQTKSGKGSAFKLLGCTGEEFMKHLLGHKNCKVGWTAENYGVDWVVDHIKPLASFDLNLPGELKAAFSYENCQPMCPRENVAKSSKVDGVKRYYKVSCDASV